MPEIRLGGIQEESIVDGPGLRFVVFTQGCPHRCAGCHNPETHDPAGGFTMDTRVLLERFGQNPLLSGITFSGGEPFMQAAPLAAIAREVKTGGKTVVVYTGYTLEALLARADTAARDLLALTDLLIDGPYVESLRDLDLTFRGSSNQRILDTGAIARAMRIPA
ncbi:Anaerobic ribonucleoside-triphosphate reductase-activating protein (fragment) [uncultured delta proteobacterium]|uniref:Anaerobic ribonucleoside-triphosphate reductase-activating protein n=1 Tax=uncultured delta proteobacterium TaxID=34034 RepID=A0A212KEY0_9DELT